MIVLTPKERRTANRSLASLDLLRPVEATRVDHHAVGMVVATEGVRPLDMEEAPLPLVTDVRSSSITSVVPNLCSSLHLRARLC
jgi:hypothetical protein